MDQNTLQTAERILGVRFRDHELLEEALTHASIAQTRLTSNERLEFLGDAVLGMLVCEHIFNEYQDLLEGDMTKIKSSVVSRRTCATIAQAMGLPEPLKLGRMQRATCLVSRRRARIGHRMRSISRRPRR